MQRTNGAEADTYFPEPEPNGGWRWLRDEQEIRDLGQMDPERLWLAAEYNGHFQASSGVVVIRHGYLVSEWYENSALTTTRYDIWSCVKSFTGTAYGFLFDDARAGRLPRRQMVDLDSKAYDFIPEGLPLSDPRKAQITFRHLLSMTSGIPGERCGIAAIPTRTGDGPFEAALGKVPAKARRWPAERWAATLTADPGASWDYSDPAFAHLSLAFANITGQEMSEVMQQRVFDVIGVQRLVWDMQGIGEGFIGPHTNAHTGIHVSARELARFGYLLLGHGRWRNEQVLPAWWLDLALQPSQPYNPNYGLTWWTNASGSMWPGVPRDAFAAMGYMGNRCYVVPSLDLVVARVGSGPTEWAEGNLLQMVVNAVIPSPQ